MKKLLSLTLCAILLLCSCNSNITTAPVQTSETKPSELILQLSHKDVFLDFFKDKKDLIFRQLCLKSGDRLIVKNNKLYARFNGKMLPVLQFSHKCYEDVKKLISSGYAPYDAVIRFICAWKGKEDTVDKAETAVILADVHFCGNNE